MALIKNNNEHESPLTPIKVNKTTKRVQVGSGNWCTLSEAEINLLSLLVDANGVVLSKEFLLSNGWGGRMVSPSSLPVAIKHIRDALNNAGYTDVLYTAKNGGGYVITNGLFCIEEGSISHPSLKKDFVNESISGPEGIFTLRTILNQKNILPYWPVAVIIFLFSMFFLAITSNSLPVYRWGNVVSDQPLENLPPQIQGLVADGYNDGHVFITNGCYLVCEHSAKRCHYVVDEANSGEGVCQ